jgi:hypothetical protein
MRRVEGSLARKLDFGEITTTTFKIAAFGAALRPVRQDVLRGPDKYKVLEHRRRQAQIRARRLLDL